MRARPLTLWLPLLPRFTLSQGSFIKSRAQKPGNAEMLLFGVPHSVCRWPQVCALWAQAVLGTAAHPPLVATKGSLWPQKQLRGMQASEKVRHHH